jgi:hypothetical protein
MRVHVYSIGVAVAMAAFAARPQTPAATSQSTSSPKAAPAPPAAGSNQDVSSRLGSTAQQSPSANRGVGVALDGGTNTGGALDGGLGAGGALDAGVNAGGALDAGTAGAALDGGVDFVSPQTQAMSGSQARGGNQTTTVVGGQAQTITPSAQPQNVQTQAGGGTVPGPTSVGTGIAIFTGPPPADGGDPTNGLNVTAGPQVGEGPQVGSGPQVGEGPQVGGTATDAGAR